jgi:murein DD-endopeptidase MepM/ murein hydrolase activator NlpD
VRLLLTALLLLIAATAQGLELKGSLTQGGLVLGRTEPGATVELDGRALRVSSDGTFVFGFGREAPPRAVLSVRQPDGTTTERLLDITPRDYDIQRIDGLPPKMVTPPSDVLARIKRENALIAETRRRDTDEVFFAGGWIRPAVGPVTGIYGSQRILNGEPRQPHYGIDYAGPAGSPVVAPAGGIVSLAQDDLYYTGGTVIIDHGHGLSSAFLHMSKVDVKPGDRVAQGQRIGAIGMSGRATGPHLDWRINWFEERIDPGLLVPEPPVN